MTSFTQPHTLATPPPDGEDVAPFREYPHHISNFSGANRHRMLKEYYPVDSDRVKQTPSLPTVTPPNHSFRVCRQKRNFLTVPFPRWSV